THVDKHLLQHMVELGEKDPKIGFIGPKIYHYPDEGFDEKFIQYAGGKQDLWRFEPQPIGYGELDQGQYDHNQRVDFISGACILARTAMIREIGLLDEEFFSYREENDWCRRGYQHGWFTCYSYQAVVWHKGQGSTRNQQPTILYYMTRNRFLFMKKHASRVQIIIFILIFVFFDSWYRTAASLFYHRQTRLVFCFWKAIKDGLKILSQ
ncbi:MAG: glycosyltransferase family 2 protein, partial [Methanobacteriales archaeon]|nr:glycosyltransferase family 2 protein [Methanobacteriales archaeon]